MNVAEWDVVPNGRATFDYRPRRPPIVLLITAALTVLVATVLFVGSETEIHVAGWLLASILTVSQLAVFTIVDSRRRRSATYSPVEGTSVIRLVLGVAGVVVAAGHAWFVASEVARW